MQPVLVGVVKSLSVVVERNDKSTFILKKIGFDLSEIGVVIFKYGEAFYGVCLATIHRSLNIIRALTRGRKNSQSIFVL